MYGILQTYPESTSESSINMGADTSRIHVPTEETIDAYINRGGARLVNRERKSATSSVVDIGIGGDTTSFSVSPQTLRTPYPVLRYRTFC